MHLLRGAPENDAVRYAVTIPGAYGIGAAFIAELAISFLSRGRVRLLADVIVTKVEVILVAAIFFQSLIVPPGSREHTPTSQSVCQFFFPLVRVLSENRVQTD